MAEQFIKAADQQIKEQESGEQRQSSKRYERVMDERHKLVDRIIENMKQGYIMPKPLWNTSQYQIHNPVSGARYKGANYAKLLIASDERGYKDPRWMTFEQAKKMGYSIKKGAVSVPLEKYVFEFEAERTNEETGEMEKEIVKLERPIINHFKVFNAEQITGIPPLSPKQENVNTDALKLADQLIASSACPVMELSQPKAFYSPANDRITLPLRNTFSSSEAFATVLMHEMIHSTGHESRLNRPLLNKFDTPEYAKEELRAELGSYFMGTDVGIEGSQEILASHTQYLESWIKVLENDPNELFRACSDAQKAVELLEGNLERQRELEKEQVKDAEKQPQLSEAQEAVVSEQQQKPADITVNEKAMPEAAIEPNPLLDSINILQLDENQYFHFSINTQDGELLEGTYRLLADANGPENMIVSLGDGHHPEVEAHRDEIKDRLAELTDFHDIKRLLQKRYQEDLTQADGGATEATEIRYPEPVIRIIHSQMDHPMLKPGNQLTFAEANRLFGSLNTKRELEIYKSNHLADPLYYQTEYKLLYQQDGIVNSIRDTYEIGGDEEDLLTHILLSKKPVHEAYEHVSMHARLDQQQQEVKLNVKKVKEQIENLRLSGKGEQNALNTQELEAANNGLRYQQELMQTVDETKIALAAGTEFPKTPVRTYSLEEYLAERGLHKPVTDYTPEEFKIPTDFKGQQKEKMLSLLKENQDDYFNAQKDAINEFHEKVKRGEIIERATDPQLDKESIMQATEEYVEEQLQITEASVALEA